MNKPYFVKINVWHPNIKNDVYIVLNLEKEAASIHLSGIAETIIWFNEEKIKNYFSNTKCFKRGIIILEDVSNKYMQETKMMLFDFLRTAKGIFYIDFLNQSKESIEIYSGPAIPFDDDEAKKFYSTSVNHRGKFEIRIGEFQD